MDSLLIHIGCLLYIGHQFHLPLHRSQTGQVRESSKVPPMAQRDLWHQVGVADGNPGGGYPTSAVESRCYTRSVMDCSVHLKENWKKNENTDVLVLLGI